MFAMTDHPKDTQERNQWNAIITSLTANPCNVDNAKRLLASYSRLSSKKLLLLPPFVDRQPLGLRDNVSGAGEWYPIGNTPAINLVGRETEQKNFAILCAASGDLRHIAHTISLNAARSFKFHLNDKEPWITARNILLLHLLSCPDVEINFVIDLWYSQRIGMPTARLKELLTVFPEQPWLKMDEATRTSAENVWLSWIELLQAEQAPKWASAPPAHLMTDCCHLQGSGGACLKSYMQKHMLLCCKEREKAFPTQNVTLIHPTMKVTTLSCVFRGWLTSDIEAKENNGDCCLSAKCRSMLSQKLASLREALTKGNVEFQFNTGDAIEYVTGLVGVEFDRIETSNLVDYIGLSSLLSACSRLLVPLGTILVTTLNWRPMFVLPISLNDSINSPETGKCDRAFKYLDDFPNATMTLDQAYHCWILREMMAIAQPHDNLPLDSPLWRVLQDHKTRAAHIASRTLSSWEPGTMNSHMETLKFLMNEISLWEWRLVRQLENQIFPVKLGPQSTLFSSGYERWSEWRKQVCCAPFCESLTAKACARCLKQTYCSKECQTKAWSDHKQCCKKLKN